MTVETALPQIMDTGIRKLLKITVPEACKEFSIFFDKYFLKEVHVERPNVVTMGQRVQQYDPQ